MQSLLLLLLLLRLKNGGVHALRGQGELENCEEVIETCVMDLYKTAIFFFTNEQSDF